MFYFGTLQSSIGQAGENNQVRGELFIKDGDGSDFWLGWLQACNGSEIQTGDYSLTLPDGRKGLVLVTGHGKNNEHGAFAIFEGQGKLPEIEHSHLSQACQPACTSQDSLKSQVP